MGGPLKNPSLAALQSRSRFCEGSMNDRASAAPPVRFLDPDSLAVFEQPVPLPPSGLGGQRRSHETSGLPTSTSNTTSTSTGSGGGGFSQTWSRKTGSKLLGQVWEGVRGRLRLRKGDDPSSSSGGGDAAKKTTGATAPSVAISAARTTTAVTQTNAETITIYTDPAERCDGPPASRTRSRLAASSTQLQPPTAPIDIPRGPASAGMRGPGNLSFSGFQSARPSRDEVLASYKQLMAGGFFHAHAIPSSRQGLGRPGTANGARPATSHYQPNHQRQAPPPPPPPSPPPSWPLATPRQEAVAPMALQSPTSASSRGTKRAATHDSDDSDESMHDRSVDMDGDVRLSDKENQAPHHPNAARSDDARQPRKRLRRFASRESLFVSKTRAGAAPPFNPNPTFPPATVHGGGGGGGGDVFFHPGPPPAINKLQKRRPSAQRLQRPRRVGGSAARPPRGRAVEERRGVRVVPDEGLGIPGVPAIPVRFTYGEDRENDGPWRGLRVR